MLRELTNDEFYEFQKNHYLSNFYQTINYGILMAEKGYDYDIIGYLDEFGNILAASLILIKKIDGKYKYGYAPRGFLINYKNEELLNKFTEEVKAYYYKKRVVFIKVNPNIAIGNINISNHLTMYNENNITVDNLINNGYEKLRDNLYFEAALPRFNAKIDLKNYDFNNLSKNTKNKIRKSIRKGLSFNKVDKNNIEEFYNIIKRKKDNSLFYYKDYYTAFERDNAIDLFLVSINYPEFLINSQNLYEKELERNTKYNENLSRTYSEHILNCKMNSDKNLLSYKNDIMEATKGMKESSNPYIAGALVIKHNDTVSIVMSGFDNNYKRFSANYFLHYSLINYYKDDYKYLDLNGIVGDFNENPYSGLNEFKLGFKPILEEFAGEFDLVIEKNLYKDLLDSGMLAKALNKKNKVSK